MNIIYAKQHLGAGWAWKSLAQRKYLLILIHLWLAPVFQALRRGSPIARQPIRSFQQIFCEAR